MAPLSEFFGVTRVINLRERTDRYSEMQAQLELMRMPFAAGRVEVLTADRTTDAAGFPSASVRGCYLSHLEALRDARARGLESVLVLEDDLEVERRHVVWLERLVDELRGQEWGIVHFGHFLPSCSGKGDPRWDKFMGDLQTAHFYAVHSSVFDRLIEYLDRCMVRPEGDQVGGPMEYDGALSMFRRWNQDVVTLIAQPSLGAQRSSRSSIHGRSIENIAGVAAAMDMLRKVKRALR